MHFHIVLSLQFLEELLELEANPNYFSYHDHQTALHFAAREGLSDVMEVLLDYGGDPMEYDIAGKSVLEVAHEAGNEDCAEVSIESRWPGRNE